VEAGDVGAVGQHALVTPVDLGLGAGGDLEAAVHLGGAIGDPELGADLRAPGAHVLLDALVGAAEAVGLGGEALVDGGRAEGALRGPQPGVDRADEGVDHPPGCRPRAVARQTRRPGEVLLRRPRVAAGETGDLAPGHAGVGQGTELLQIHPFLLLHHGTGHLRARLDFCCVEVRAGRRRSPSRVQIRSGGPTRFAVHLGT